jgi:hypothetical protein
MNSWPELPAWLYGDEFYIQSSSEEPFHRNGVLSHRGMKMTFAAGEFERAVEWLK